MRNPSAIILLLTLMTLSGCQEGGFLHEYRENRLNRIYGRRVPEKEIARLQKEVAQYEKDIRRIIEAGEKSAAIHRQIALSFAELEAFEQCLHHIQLAAKLGSIDAKLKYMEGLCYGNLAQRNNWKYEYASAAEQAYLAALLLDPTEAAPKFELGLLYFHGFGRNNRYRVLNEEITITQRDFRAKGMQLIREYQQQVPDDARGYLALAGMHRILGENAAARTQLNLALDAWRRSYPDSFASLPEYQQALQNLQSLNVND